MTDDPKPRATVIPLPITPQRREHIDRVTAEANAVLLEDAQVAAIDLFLARGAPRQAAELAAWLLRVQATVNALILQLPGVDLAMLYRDAAQIVGEFLERTQAAMRDRPPSGE